MLPRKASVVIGISSGSGGNGGGASGGVGDGTSGCGGKILSWGGKCGLGAIVGVGLVGAIWGLGPVGAGFLSGWVGAGWGPGGWWVRIGGGGRLRGGWDWLWFSSGVARGVGSPFFCAFLLVLAEFLFCAGGLGTGLSFYGV